MKQTEKLAGGFWKPVEMCLRDIKAWLFSILPNSALDFHPVELAQSPNSSTTYNLTGAKLGSCLSSLIFKRRLCNGPFVQTNFPCHGGQPRHWVLNRTNSLPSLSRRNIHYRLSQHLIRSTSSPRTAKTWCESHSRCRRTRRYQRLNSRGSTRLGSREIRSS